MTAQLPERLRYKGKRLELCTLPLEDYFEAGGASPDFEPSSTALGRGYVGEWSIVRGRLYLVRLRGMLVGGHEASLETVFPGHSGRVLAEWFSGTLCCPQGRLLQYFHGGFGSVYESDLLIDIERGVVTGTREQYNDTTASDEKRMADGGERS
jgi:hypothetical protein